jgi:hypothetical protein
VSIDDRTARLAGVRERLAKATPGGWVVQSGALCPRGALVGSLATDEWFVVVEPHAGGRQYADGWVEPFVPQAQAEADAALIANAPADLAFLLALVDEQATEIERGRRALYRVMQACGIQGEATPETLAGMDVALCGEVGARNIADAWRLARERAAEIERLRGEVEAESRRADDAEQARDYETYYHARAKKKIERLEGQAAAAESRGAEGERAAVVAWLRSEDVERHGLAARIARGEHLPAPSSAPEEGARGDEGHAVPDGVAAWRCSSCGFWCTLIENANHHANRTGHAFTHDPGANGTRSRDGHYADMVAALLGVPRG